MHRVLLLVLVVGVQLANDDSIAAVFNTVYNDSRMVASWVSDCIDIAILIVHNFSPLMAVF